jgi:hypothetical protein
VHEDAPVRFEPPPRNKPEEEETAFGIHDLNQIASGSIYHEWDYNAETEEFFPLTGLKTRWYNLDAPAGRRIFFACRRSSIGGATDL